MGRFDDKVVFITGAARGQGRALARRFAAEGANVIAVDVCAPVLPDLGYPAATEDDLAETGRLVEQAGRGCVTRVADVRQQGALDAAVAEGVDRFGRLDVVVANAGIASYHLAVEVPEEHWAAVLDVNLTGVWRTVKAAVPAIVAGGEGGVITITSSAAGLRAFPYLGHYAATKHALVGLMRTLAIELGPDGIRVNTIHPGAVDTPMGHDPNVPRLIEASPQLTASYTSPRPLGGGAQTPDDIADTVLWLSSGEARFVTGATIPIDGGTVVR
jgi:SDR family mycofactocin-dependent oxidoreductase